MGRRWVSKSEDQHNRNEDYYLHPLLFPEMCKHILDLYIFWMCQPLQKALLHPTCMQSRKGCKQEGIFNKRVLSPYHAKFLRVGSRTHWDRFFTTGPNIVEILTANGQLVCSIVPGRDTRKVCCTGVAQMVSGSHVFSYCVHQHTMEKQGGNFLTPACIPQLEKALSPITTYMRVLTWDSSMYSRSANTVTEQMIDKLVTQDLQA